VFIVKGNQQKFENQWGLSATSSSQSTALDFSVQAIEPNAL